jgi:rhodanese-related sulfurtransferase
MNRFKKAIRQGLLMTVLGLVLGLGINALRHDGLPLLKSGKQEITVVSVGEAWKLYQQGKAVFLDAREAEVYRSAHLPGAIHVPVESARTKEAELRSFAESKKMLIAYCDGQGCNKAQDLAGALAADRLPGVAMMPEGWLGWMESGLPVEEGGP